MFDKSLFINHFNNGKQEEHPVYQSISVDPRGVRWGYIAKENVYEEINTGRRLTPLMLENFILEQTDTALGDGGDYGTEAGHGSSKLPRSLLTPKDIRQFGEKLDFENFGAPRDDNTSLYTQRASVSTNAANTAQDLVTGAVFKNTSQLPTVGYVSIRPVTSGVKGMILHSSVDSAEGVTFAAGESGGYTTDASPGGVATDLHSYLCEGQTWANTNQGGSGCVLTVRTGVSGAFSPGSEIKYTWNAASNSPDAQNSIFLRYSLNDIDETVGPVGATWPGTTLDPVAGTAYWGHNPEFYIQIGSKPEVKVEDRTNVIQDVSKI